MTAVGSLGLDQKSKFWREKINFDPKSLMIIQNCPNQDGVLPQFDRSHFIRVPMNFNDLRVEDKPAPSVKITAVICNFIKQNKTG